MDFSAIFSYLMTLAPWVSTAFMILGSLVLVGTFIDAMVPDEKDGGFMKKIMAFPIIGPLLEQLKRFSPFNIKDKEEPKE